MENILIKDGIPTRVRIRFLHMFKEWQNGKYAKSEYSVGVENAGVELAGTFIDTHDLCGKVLKDSALSHDGKNEKIKSIKKESHQKIISLRAKRSLQKQIASVRDKMKLEKFDDSSRAYLKRSEIRNRIYYSGMDPEEIAERYIEFNKNGKDPAFISAIEEMDGKALPIIPSDTVARGREIRLKRRNPDEYASFQELTAVDKFIGELFDVAEQAMQEMM